MLRSFFRGFVVRRVTYASPQSRRISSALTPCGTQIYVGSTENEISIFSTFSGELMKKLPTVLGFSSLMDMNYHPSKFMFAYCGLGTNEKTVILRHGCTQDTGSLVPESGSRSVISVNRGLKYSEHDVSPETKCEKIASIMAKLEDLTVGQPRYVKIRKNSITN